MTATATAGRREKQLDQRRQRFTSQGLDLRHPIRHLSGTRYLTTTAARKHNRSSTLEPVIDADLLLRRKLRAAARPVEGADFLLRRIVEDLTDRLSTVKRRFERAAVLFSPPGTAQALHDTGQVDEVAEIGLHARLMEPGGVPAPAETVTLEPSRFDLAVSLLSLHEVNDLPGMLIQIRRILKPDGLFLAALAGAGTLDELRRSLLDADAAVHGGASPRVLPFADVRDMGGLLQRAGFALPVADIDTLTVRYADMFGLMADLRAMGATNPLVDRSRRPATRGLFAEAARCYGERFADPDGRVRATFNIVWLSGWAPAPTQQKPLKPGSATTSLADALRLDPIRSDGSG